jgi:hypothetical protein
MNVLFHDALLPCAAESSCFSPNQIMEMSRSYCRPGMIDKKPPMPNGRLAWDSCRVSAGRAGFVVTIFDPGLDLGGGVWHRGNVTATKN